MASDEGRRVFVILLSAFLGGALHLILSSSTTGGMGFLSGGGGRGDAGLLQRRCAPLVASVPAVFFFPHVALTLSEYHDRLREGSEVQQPSPLRSFRVAFVGSPYCHLAWEALTILQPRVSRSVSGASATDGGVVTDLDFVVALDSEEPGAEFHPSCDVLRSALGVRLVTGPNASEQFEASTFDWIFVASPFVTDSATQQKLQDSIAAAFERRLWAWWPKLQPGGLLSGDHFNDPGLRWIYSHWGHHGPVVTAVSRFATALKLHVNPTQNSIHFLRANASVSRPQAPEWYTVKPSRSYTNRCRRLVVPHDSMVDRPLREIPLMTSQPVVASTSRLSSTTASPQEFYRQGEAVFIPEDEYDKGLVFPRAPPRAPRKSGKK